MKLPKHLEERRDNWLGVKPTLPMPEEINDALSYGFKRGYDAAVADMLKEIEPLVEGAKEYVASNFECRDAKLINAFRTWQKKFGGEGD